MKEAVAGPLSRFFAGDGDPSRLRSGIEAWRSDLRAALADGLAEELDWDEGAAEGVRADLGDSGWAALRLFAFYAERTDLGMPDTVPRSLELDREWRMASDGKFARSCYGHLLACDVWLPGDFPVTINAPMPNGEAAEIGSVTVLVDQLRWLNRRTFACDEEAIASWNGLSAPEGGALLDAARRGFAGMWSAARFAADHRLPLAVRE